MGWNCHNIQSTQLLKFEGVINLIFPVSERLKVLVTLSEGHPKLLAFIVLAYLQITIYHTTKSQYISLRKESERKIFNEKHIYVQNGTSLHFEFRVKDPCLNIGK